MFASTIDVTPLLNFLLTYYINQLKKVAFADDLTVFGKIEEIDFYIETKYNRQIQKQKNCS